MPIYSTDKDLLHWEPNVMIDAATIAQPMLAGTGNLEGTTFSIADSGSVTLEDAHVGPGHVIVFSGGSITGSFPVVSIVNPTKLNLSVLYDDILEAPEDAPASSVGWGDGINFSIRTFWPQRKAASDSILALAGIRSRDAEAIIVNPEVLRRPCVLATMQIIHIALASSADDPEPELMQADLYGRLFRRALRAVTLELDLNRDGQVDERRTLSTLTARRV